MTRGMAVTLIYRMAGSPPIRGDSSFVDVAADDWYGNAVAWAQENGIAYGMSATHFQPNGTITREQMAAFLYRYAQYCGEDTTCRDLSSVYTDVGRISQYGLTPMAWAVSHGLITGMSSSILAPQNHCTRAQAAAIFVRYMDDYAS